MILGDSSTAAETAAPSDHFQLKALPTILGVLAAFGLSFLSFLTVEFFKLAVHLPERPQMPWLADYYYHVALFCFAYGAILLLKMQKPGDYGFRWPVGASYFWVALLSGIILGAMIMLFENWSQLVEGRRLFQFNALTPWNIAGWVAFDGIAIGVSQETLFRGYLVSYLAQMMPGRVNIFGISISGAAIVAAPIFAIFSILYSGYFLVVSFPILLAQFLCYCALGVLCGHWFERSQSLLGPIVGHNAAALTGRILVFVLLPHSR